MARLASLLRRSLLGAPVSRPIQAARELAEDLREIARLERALGRR